MRDNSHTTILSRLLESEDEALSNQTVTENESHYYGKGEFQQM